MTTFANKKKTKFLENWVKSSEYPKYSTLFFKCSLKELNWLSHSTLKSLRRKGICFESFTSNQLYIILNALYIIIIHVTCNPN